MQIINRAFPLLLLLGCLSLASCDDACDYNESCSNSSTNPAADDGNGTADDTDTTADVGGSSLSYLDCTSLNPNRVYLHGAFDPSRFGTTALVDPSDPTLFCVGFPESLSPGTIAPSGAYTFRSDGNVFEMVLDGLTMSGAGRWLYPNGTLDNDEGLVVGGISSSRFLRHPTTGEVFFQNISSLGIFRETQPHQAYFSPLGTHWLLAVMPDNAMLLFSAGSNLLVHVDPSLVETALTTPTSTDTILETSRLFTDGGDQKVWIGLYIVDGTTISHHRWSVDLSTLTVTDDGEFAALPAGVEVNPLDFDSRLDGDGNLWQIGENSAAPAGADRVVVRRPLLSSGEPSTTVYREADYTGGTDWSSEMEPYVLTAFQGGLVTGP